jgi:hypothetical protein
MKGKRIDNKTRAKLITKRINEWKDAKDIAREEWISERSTQRIIHAELAEVGTKSEAIAELIDRNNNLQSLADAMIASKLKSGEESIKLSELVSLRDSTFKQNQLVQGKATENVWIISEITIL